MFRRTVIPCDGGLEYLIRYRLVETPWFGVYLHDIKEPDHDYDPHDHPWRFASWIVWGGYTESIYPHPVNYRDLHYERNRKRWGWHRMGTVAAHRITAIQPHTWSLIIRGKRREGWGFHTRDGYVPWQTYKKGTL